MAKKPQPKKKKNKLLPKVITPPMTYKPKKIKRKSWDKKPKVLR